MNLLPSLIFKFFFFITLCLVSIQAKSLSLSLEEQQWIAQNPSITLGSDYAWPPYDFVNEQKQHAGISADLIEIIRQKTGLNIQIKSGVWADVMTELRAGELDGLVCAAKTPEREDYLSFSTPYASMPLAIIVQTSNSRIHRLADLKNRLVAVNKGSYLHEWLQINHPDISLYLTTSNTESLNAVSFGKAEAYLGNIAVATYVIKQSYLTNLKIVDKVHELETKTSIAIDKQQPILMSIIQKALDSISPVEKKVIHEKWFAESQQNSVTLTEKELEWISRNQVVKVAAETDWAPFDFTNQNQEFSGIANDYLALIAQKTGLNFEVTTDSWESNLKYLTDKKTDLLPAAFKTEDRGSFALFSEPYFETLNYFFIRDDLQVKEVADLNGKTLAIPKGYAQIATLKESHPEINILETNSLYEAIEAVIQDRAQILYDIYPVLSYSLREAGINTIVPFKAIQKKRQAIHFMLRKDAPELHSIVNKALSAITDEERNRIAFRWLAVTPDVHSNLAFDLSDDERKWMLKNRIVHFGGDPDRLPFEAFTDEGLYIGIVADYLKAIAEYLSIEFQTTHTASWQETLTLADQKKLDVISGDADGLQLAKNYLSIPSYLTSPVVIIMDSQASFVNSLEELQGKSIAVVKGCGYIHALYDAFPEQSFIELNTANDVLDSVSLGHNDAALLSLPAANYLIKQNGFHNLQIVGKTPVEMNLTLFVNKDQPVLHSMLSKVMAQVSQEKGRDILNSWTKLNFATKINYWLIVQILLVSLVIIGVVFYWNVKLAKEITQRKKIEEYLQVEKDNFKSLFEKATDAHLIVQKNQFVACNKAALKILGIKHKSDLLNSTPADWSPETQPNGQRSALKHKHLIRECMNEGAKRFDWILHNEKGEPFWVDAVFTAIQYLGKPAIYVSWRDQTEQKALEKTLKQSEEQIQLLIDSIPLIVLVTNYEGHVLSANLQALEDYNLCKESLSELNILNFYQNQQDREEIKATLQKEGRVDQKIVSMKDIEGRSREMMLSIIPIHYNKQAALLTISVDLTDRIYAEKQLHEAKEQAETANRTKTEFLANMSHEIRTPMNAIIGFTELLNEQVSEPRLKSFINTIQSAGNTLLMLINDILDLSKIEAGKMAINLQATNPHDLFKEVGDIFTMNIQKKGLDFYIDIDPSLPSSLLLDPVRLRQILFNLLGNAVKFTETGSIKLSVKSVNVIEHLSKLDILIQVEDTGIGIAEDQQERIFDAFEQQTGQDANKFGGTGLGLSITKRLVDMMKGQLSLVSVPNTGSTFSILLEKVDIASVGSKSLLNDALALTPSRIQFDPATILIVDDILDNRELINQNLIDSGVVIRQAQNGQEAIDIYKKHAIDLVLMDIRMPVLDGYEAAKIIKSLNPNIPIIALTASVMQDEYEKIKREYFDDYLRKPVLRNDLFYTLTKFLKHQEIAVAESPENPESDFLGALNDKQSFSVALLQALETLEPLFIKATKSNSVEDIKHFAKELAKLASQHDCLILDKLASQLLEKVDSFDIAGMQFLLKQYQSLSVDDSVSLNS